LEQDVSWDTVQGWLSDIGLQKRVLGQIEGEIMIDYGQGMEGKA
jgi:hypothetical protein